MAGDDRATQLDELESLKSIYLEDEFHITETDSCKDIQAVFLAHIELPEKFVVIYKSDLNDSNCTSMPIKYLPPIELSIVLPNDYPSKHPPSFKLFCQWLNRKSTSVLCEKLDSIWLEGNNSEILFSWCEFLKNESLNTLNITNTLDITEIHSNYLLFLEKRKLGQKMLHAKQPVKTLRNKTGARNLKHESCSQTRDKRVARGNRSRKRQIDKNMPVHDIRSGMKLSISTSLVKLLMNYNTDREKMIFNKTMFTCMICFDDKLGRNCTKFSKCDHIFCKDCIKNYLLVRINEGTVQAIKCPQEKCDSEVLPSVVRELVPEKLFEKYDSLLLTLTLDTLGDIIYCPRHSCQYPCTRNAEDKVVTCPACCYSFCVFCKMVYHGVEPCKFKSDEMQKLISQYTNANAEERKEMESRYGKTQLQTVVNTSLSESWIKENSKNCPQCNASIEKADGCNKMSCWRCNAYFCWLCSKLLSTIKPYTHYNDPDSPCANKLYYLVHLDEEQDEEEWEPFDWVDLSDVSDLSDIETDEPDTDNEL